VSRPMRLRHATAAGSDQLNRRQQARSLHRTFRSPCEDRGSTHAHNGRLLLNVQNMNHGGWLINLLPSSWTDEERREADPEDIEETDLIPINDFA
jgi:hypothetical protein